MSSESLTSDSSAALTDRMGNAVGSAVSVLGQAIKWVVLLGIGILVVGYWLNLARINFATGNTFAAGLTVGSLILVVGGGIAIAHSMGVFD